MFEHEKDADKDRIKRRILQEGCSNVLVAKLLDEKTVQMDNRPMSCMTPREWSALGWYQSYADACATPYMVAIDILRIETALFEAETDKLLWSTQIHSELTSSPTDKDIEGWTRLVISTMLDR